MVPRPSADETRATLRALFPDPAPLPEAAWERIAEDLPVALPPAVTTKPQAGFRLFHMTHFDNVERILQHGLLAHNLATGYRDISNTAVNDRRAGILSPAGRPLHDYVPMYFNPRNAMLFEKQTEFAGRIAVLELSPDLGHAKGAVFSEGNAASGESRLTDRLDDLRLFDWDRINATSWRDGKEKNLTVRRLMMSECLVPDRVGASSVLALHVADESLKRDLSDCIGSRQDIVRVSPEWFFEVAPVRKAAGGGRR